MCNLTKKKRYFLKRAYLDVEEDDTVQIADKDKEHPEIQRY